MAKVSTERGQTDVQTIFPVPGVQKNVSVTEGFFQFPRFFGNMCPSQKGFFHFSGFLENICLQQKGFFQFWALFENMCPLQKGFLETSGAGASGPGALS